MSGEDLIKDMETKMQKSLSVLDHDLGGLRTGRASVALLDPVIVNAYGSRSPISQVATVSAPESRLLTVQVWDKSLAKEVEKAIVEANLGLSPIGEGQTIRIPIPPLNEERRKEMVKLAHKYSENAKVNIRNVRRTIMDDLKKLEKDSKISEDQLRGFNDKVQKITDDYAKKIDDKVEAKEKEILTV